MKKMTVEKMIGLQGGSNRQCLIDGALTVVAIGLGVASGGLIGGLIGFAGGLFAGNANGCFEK